MNSSDLDKFYISPYDTFLTEFDATHKLSESQIKEIEKHKLIAKRRDDKDYKKKDGVLWESF
jgi:hypothetical protein